MLTSFEYKQITTISDLADLIQVYQEVFELPELMLPKGPYLQRLLSNSSTIFLAAYAKDKIIGGLTAHLLPSVYSELNELYLYDLAVLTRFQRKGVGRGLLNALNELAKTLHVSEVYVQADADDEGALEFYKATGGQGKKVWHFVYPVA